MPELTEIAFRDDHIRQAMPGHRAAYVDEKIGSTIAAAERVQVEFTGNRHATIGDFKASLRHLRQHLENLERVVGTLTPAHLQPITAADAFDVFQHDPRAMFAMPEAPEHLVHPKTVSKTEGFPAGTVTFDVGWGTCTLRPDELVVVHSCNDRAGDVALYGECMHEAHGPALSIEERLARASRLLTELPIGTTRRGDMAELVQALRDQLVDEERIAKMHPPVDRAALDLDA